MAGKPIFPMAYTIKPETSAKIYYIGFPTSWKTELIKIAKENNPKFKSEYGLPTYSLQKTLDSWLDGIVSASVLKEYTDDNKWLASTKPFDKERINILTEIIKVWITAEYISKPKTSPSVKNKAEKLRDSMRCEELFDLLSENDVCLSLPDGRVSDEAYQAIPLLVVNRLIGKNIEICGTPIHLMYAAKNELVSSVITDHNTGHKYSFVFQFSVQTTPPERHALLLCHASIRRWILGRINRTKSPFLKNDIIAHVQVSEDKYCQGPIQYSYKIKGLDWSFVDKECYDLYHYKALKNVSDVWEAVENGSEDILLPYKNGMDSFAASKIGTGVPVRDKAEAYERFFDLLQDIVSKPTTPTRIAAKQKISYYRSPQEYPSTECFRKWVYSCAETSEIRFELYANLDDPIEFDLLEQIGKKIIADFGENTADSCMTIKIEKKNIGNIAMPVDTTDKMRRCDEILALLGVTDDVVAVGSICVIPGANSFKGDDPKNVIRNAFARSGRVVQFVVPTDVDQEKIDHTVYDLYRQLGITMLINTEKLQTHSFKDMTCVGMHIFTQVHGMRNKARSMPVFVSLDLNTGRTRVQCAAFEKDNVNYRQACLEMAKLYWNTDLEELCKNASFSPAKQKLLEMKHQFSETTPGALLLIHSDGNTRPLWGGISDKSISSYHEIADYIPEQIDAGSNKNTYPMSLNETGIRIIRVRNNSEVPDYYTSQRDNSCDGDLYSSASGIFQYGKVFWAIPSKPNDPRYNRSLSESRLNSPKHSYAEKDMIEIYPIQLQSCDDPAAWIKYVADLSLLSIQYNQSTILPIPLHLAKNLEEYLFE